MYKINPNNYQDVKANLQWYTSIILVIIGLLFYLLVLPVEHRQIVNTFFGNIPPSQIIGSAIVIGLYEFLGWFLIFYLEIHDKIYDYYFVKWRFYYDLDFILPCLVRPFTHKLDKRFFQVAQNNRSDFMKLFYYFVGDGKHNPKIRDTLLTRFYENITKYWITQINEILLFILLILTFIYYFIYSNLALPLNTIVLLNFIIEALFIVNRFGVLQSRKKVRLATADEIEDIHDRFSSELEEELKKLHQKFNLEYGNN